MGQQDLAFITTKVDEDGVSFKFNLVFCNGDDNPSGEFLVTGFKCSQQKHETRHQARAAAKSYCLENGIHTTNSGWLSL
jgi:hypothetical protein